MHKSLDQKVISQHLWKRLVRAEFWPLMVLRDKHWPRLNIKKGKIGLKEKLLEWKPLDSHHVKYTFNIQ